MKAANLVQLSNPICRSAVEWLMPPGMRTDIARWHSARRLIAFHLAMFVWIPVFALANYVLGAPWSALIMLAGGIGVMASFATFWYTHSPAVCGHAVGLSAWALYTALALVNGGIHAPVMVWYASIPVLTLLMSGAIAGGFWTAVSGLTVVGLFLADMLGVPVYNELSGSASDWMMLLAVLGLLTCIYVLVWVLNDMDLRAHQALHEVNQLLQVQASTDPLTGFANRRSFDLVFDSEWKRHERTQLPLSMIMLDVDFFKQFNDACGHPEGDRCLQAVAGAIRSGLQRAGDFLARYGGDEFVVILPNTDLADAQHLANEIHRQVKALQIPHPNSPVSSCVTVTIGLASGRPKRDESPRSFLRDADFALYLAKSSGRDRTAQAPAEVRWGRKPAHA